LFSWHLLLAEEPVSEPSISASSFLFLFLFSLRQITLVAFPSNRKMEASVSFETLVSVCDHTPQKTASWHTAVRTPVRHRSMFLPCYKNIDSQSVWAQDTVRSFVSTEPTSNFLSNRNVLRV
jgi:hypothetical protein